MSNNWWLGLAIIAAIAGFAAMLILKNPKLPGPARLSASEPPLVILRMIGVALGTWALCLLAMGWVHAIRLKQHGQPPTTALSDEETVIYGGLTELSVFAALLATTIVTRRDGVRQVGIGVRRIPMGVLGGFLGILIVLPLVIYVDISMDWLLHRLGKSPPPHQLLEILKTNPPLWLRAAVVLSAGLVAPLAEEMFFRGVLQTFFRYVFKGSWLAIILASAAFAMMHQWWTWPQIFFLGFCLGYAYERTGNLWMTITMHALFNLTSIYAFTQWG